MSEKEMTAPVVSVGADTEQPSQNLIDNSLTDFDPNFKRFDAVQRKFLQMMDPIYLKTVSMSELLDNVYQSKPPLMNGLLYRGTYLFVGAPKLGKSFLMTQLAYHISTGTPQKVREVGGDNYSYANDYQIITRLKALADNYGICLLLVHHTRKQQADDKFDMISGTTGLLGAADGVFLLTKEMRTSNVPASMCPAEISRISGCTFSAMRKPLRGSWSVWKRSLGKRRRSRYWSRFRLSFLRAVRSGKEHPRSLRHFSAWI